MNENRERLLDQLTERQRACVPTCTFELIPIRDLVSLQDYQRRLNERHVDEIVNDFDVRFLNVVKVSRRNGINYVYDGQHTMETVAQKSGSRDTPVWCQVYCNLDYQDEAKIVADQDEHSKPLSSYEKWKAHIEAGDIKQKEINELVQSFQLPISRSGVKRGICAVCTLERIYDKYGLDILRQSIDLALKTWDQERNSLSGCMLMGIAILLHTYGLRLHKDVFIRSLGKVPVLNIIRKARERRPGSMGYAEALIVFYNSSKNKFALPMHSLYGGS